MKDSFRLWPRVYERQPIDGGGAIFDGIVNSAELGTSAVTTAKIKDAAVTSDKVGSDAITEGKIKDFSISASKIQTNALGSIAIGTGAITSAELASSAVTQGKINDGAVNTAKLASNAVTNAKVDTNAAIAKSKVSSTGTWTAAEIPSLGVSKLDDVNTITLNNTWGSLQTNQAPTADTLYLFPMEDFCPIGSKISQVGVRFNGGSTGNFRIGYYEKTRNSQIPQLIAESASTAYAGTNTYTLPFTERIVVGKPYVAVVVDGTFNGSLQMDNDTKPTGGIGINLEVAHTFGALPTNPTGLSISSIENTMGIWGTSGNRLGGKL